MFFTCFGDKEYPEEAWADVWLKEVFVASALCDTFDLLGQLTQEELVPGLAQLLARMEKSLPDASDLRLGEEAWAVFLADHESALFEALARAHDGGEGEDAFKTDGVKLTRAMLTPAFQAQMADMNITQHFGSSDPNL